MQRARVAGSELAALAAWWRHETKALAQDLVDCSQPHRLRGVTLLISESEARVTARKANAPIEDVALVYDAQRLLPESLQEFWPPDRPQQVRLEIGLSPDSVLLRQMALPALADREIAKMVELRLERELPLARDRLYVDWTIVERKKNPNQANHSQTSHNQASHNQASHGQVVVAIGIVRKEWLDRILTRVRQWGWKPVRVGLCSAVGSLQFNFLETLQHSRATTNSRLHPLMTLSASLVVALAVVLGGQWIYERARLSKALNVAQLQLQTHAKQRRKLERESEPLMRLKALMKKPSTAQVLIDLTESLPSDTWVSDLEIQRATDNQATIRLVGYAPSAVGLVNLIESKEQFAGVELISSAVGFGSQGERVELSAKWAPPATDHVAIAGLQ